MASATLKATSFAPSAFSGADTFPVCACGVLCVTPGDAERIKFHGSRRHRAFRVFRCVVDGLLDCMVLRLRYLLRHFVCERIHCCAWLCVQCEHRFQSPVMKT